jgi:hypothetical protein
MPKSEQEGAACRGARPETVSASSSVFVLVGSSHRYLEGGWKKEAIAIVAHRWAIK